MTTPTDLAQALLPCPFCGSNPEINRQGNAHTLKRRVVIRCPKCRIERADAATRRDMKWIEEIAIEHWNRRVHESRAQPASAYDLITGSPISAKPLKWENDNFEWYDENGCGFFIRWDPLEPDTELQYSAAWGEGEDEHFGSLEDAQAWCQRTIDSWVRENSVITLQPPAQPANMGDGWVMVPREPTPGMVQVGKHAAPYRAADVYRAMVLAAPQPQAKENEDATKLRLSNR